MGALLFASSSRSSNCDFKPDIGRKQALRARRKGPLGALGIALKVMRPLRIPQTPDLGAAESYIAFGGEIIIDEASAMKTYGSLKRNQVSQK